MIEGEKFIEIVNQFYSFLETEFGYKKVNEIINGNAFYNVDFIKNEKLVSISYENIADHLEVIIFILKNGEMPSYDDKTKTLHIKYLNKLLFKFLTKEEIHLNNLHFENLNTSSILEYTLLKEAKELRLCLKHFDLISNSLSL
jgi:hypothetical protein